MNRRALLRRLGVAGAAGSGVVTGRVAATPESGAESGTGEADESHQTRQSVTAPAGGAPQLRYDAANSGHVPDGSVPTEGVTDRWTFDTGGSLSVQPTVVDGTVYVGNTDGQLYAIDAQSGTERWSRNHDATLDAGVVVSGGIVYLPAGERLLAYSAATGDGQFAVDFDAAVGTPTVADGTLYLRNGSRISAVDATSGDVYWNTDSLIDGRYTEARTDELAVTVADGSVYAVYPDDDYGASVYLYSFPAGESGDASPSWRTEIVEFVDDEPTYDTTVTAVGGTLYAGLWGSDDSATPAGLLAVDPPDGSEIWRYTEIGAVQTYPVATDNTVYAAATDELVAVDPALGTAKWATSLSGAPTSPVLVGETLVFGSADDNVYAYDTDGNERWSFQTGNDVTAPPVAVDGTVYATSTDGLVYALETNDASPTAPDVTGDGNPATDPDGDGLFEDVNGDGSFSVVDVQALFANLDSDAVQDNPELFDFNGDGAVDVTDVQALFAALQEEG